MNFNVDQLATSFSAFLPEIALGLFFVIGLLLDAFMKGPKKNLGYWALAGFITAGLLALLHVGPDVGGGLATGAVGSNAFRGDWIFMASHQIAGQGMYLIDNFAIYFKVLIALAGAIVTVFSLLSRELEIDGKPRLGEYYSLMLAMTFGMFLMVSANDLLLMYLAIEIVSLSSYAIVGFTKNVPRSAEASMKYVIYGGVSSGIMIFGISIIYGMLGTTNFGEIMSVLSTKNVAGMQAQPFMLGCIMVLAGLGYKISAAPFHFWTPDVYEGGPITMTAFLSVASKAAGFAVLIRFVLGTVPETMQGFSWTSILGPMSVLTMTLGNLAALQQSNLKRLLAYSSIAHAGYMLMGLVVGSSYGVAAIMIYFAIYLVMNLGAFFAVQKVAEQIGSEEIEDYRGLGPRMPLVGILFSVFMISLVGLPPTAGFIGKLFLFNSLIDGGRDFLWLAVIGAVNSVVSLYYYVRVLKVMYLEKPTVDAPSLTFTLPTKLILGTLAVATLLLGLPNFFGPLVGGAQESLGTLSLVLRDSAVRAIGGL
jgi:NADH-quinone oxidoreductase subunit N